MRPFFLGGDEACANQSAQVEGERGGRHVEAGLALLFGVFSLLYATVGQAGGTAFLALMAFATFPSTEMRLTPLALNIVAAAFSTWVFNREKVVYWRKLRPLRLSSLPTALVGGVRCAGRARLQDLDGIRTASRRRCDHFAS